MSFIQLEGVSKIYNPGQVDEITAVSHASLAVEQGSVVALTGPSGSGKTTLLSLVGCMARPTEGKIQVGFKDVVKLPERFLTEVRRNTFGFIFQQFHLIRELTVLNNVLLPLFPLNTPMHTMKQKAFVILNQFNIEQKANVKVKALSGGEQQRVAIARAMIHSPEVIIADEPTAHLDRKLAREFMDILAMLQGEGKTVVIATHDPFIYENGLVDTIISMEDGSILRITDR